MSQTKTDETSEFKPKFDDKGLIPCITKSAESGDIIMFAYMNETALNKTLETGEVYYWSRSRNELWHKGATSGTTQIVRDITIDCDQDCLLVSVDIMGSGAGCHTGRKSCFYRTIKKDDNGKPILNFKD